MANPLYGSNKTDALVDNVIGQAVSKIASYSLSAAMSGEVHILSGAAITATLPSLKSGLRFTLISGDDSEHVIDGGASLIYYIGSYGGDHATNTGRDVHETVSSLTLNAGAINDKVEIVCDGTKWLCHGVTKATMDAG